MKKRISRRTIVVVTLLFNLAGAVAPQSATAQLAVGVTPAAGLYSGAAGFEGHLHLDWQPDFLPAVLDGTALAAMMGISTISGSEIDTLGFMVAVGVLYEYSPGPVDLRPGLYAGVQYSTFDGVDAEDEIPFLLQPHIEAAYQFPFGLSAGLYLGYKALFYDEFEGSITLGPRVRYRF